MNKRRLTSDETLPIMLSFAGAIGVLPLAIIRLRDGDWMIGLFDAFLVVCMAGLGLYVLRTQRVRVASVLLSIVCVIGVVTTIALKGPAQSFWAYPAVLAVFFLLSPREASVAALTMIVGMAPVLVLNAPGITATSVLVTLLVTSAFAYAFSVLTNDQREQLFNLASHDPLTGAGNRRAFEERLDDIVARNQRQPLSASLLMLDLDHFKR
ncbi:MAG: GGDEF domain-containing protein, partial [Pseudomonadota bacterium]